MRQPLVSPRSYFGFTPDLAERLRIPEGKPPTSNHSLQYILRPELIPAYRDHRHRKRKLNT